MDIQWITTVACFSYFLPTFFLVLLFLISEWFWAAIHSHSSPQSTPTHPFLSVLPYIFLWDLLSPTCILIFSFTFPPHTHWVTHSNTLLKQINMLHHSWVFSQLPKSHKTHCRSNHHSVFQPQSFAVSAVLTALNRCTLALGLLICPRANWKDSAVEAHDWFWSDAALWLKTLKYSLSSSRQGFCLP